MSKKPKKNKARKGSQAAKKLTAAQQKRAERAIAKKLERQGAGKNVAKKAAELIKQGENKNVAKNAAEFINMGYRSKAALVAARNAKGTAKQINEERKAAIKSKFDDSNVIMAVIDKYFPNAKYNSDLLAELIAQGKYEEIAEEYHRDLYRYADMLYDKLETAKETGAANAKEIEADYDAFIGKL